MLGNDFPYDSATKMNMDPHSKRRKALETLGDGEPSKNPDLQSGISIGISQRTRDGGQSDGSMPAQGSTFTVQGAPGWSSSPQGKKFNQDSEYFPKTKPIK